MIIRALLVVGVLLAPVFLAGRYAGGVFNPNKPEYVGEYRGEKRHGQGTTTYANGGSYIGGF